MTTLNHPIHFWATVCKTVRPMLSDRCPVCLCCLSVTFVHCGQTVRRIKMKLGTQLGLGPGQIVLDGDPAPPPAKGHSPQFSAHICFGQTAAWIKTPLGMELGLRPGDFVLDGTPLPLSKRGRTPKFSARLLWPNGWMDQGGTWHGVGLSPGDSVLDENPASLPTTGWSSRPNFRPISVVAKRLDASRCHLAWR